MKLQIVHFCSIFFEKLEFLLPLLPKKRYYEWRYIAVLLRLLKNCRHSTTSCFTKKLWLWCAYDSRSQRMWREFDCVCREFIFCLVSKKIIFLHILNVRVSHCPAVLPALKLNIPQFVAARKTVQWTKCFENHWTTNTEMITFEPELLYEFF